MKAKHQTPVDVGDQELGEAAQLARQHPQWEFPDFSDVYQRYKAAMQETLTPEDTGDALSPDLREMAAQFLIHGKQTPEVRAKMLGKILESLEVDVLIGELAAFAFGEAVARACDGGAR